MDQQTTVVSAVVSPLCSHTRQRRHASYYPYALKGPTAHFRLPIMPTSLEAAYRPDEVCCRRFRRTATRAFGKPSHTLALPTSNRLSTDGESKHCSSYKLQPHLNQGFPAPLPFHIKINASTIIWNPPLRPGTVVKHGHVSTKIGIYPPVFHNNPKSTV
ncbi:hypothetical protein XPA_007889 [Xanthoria parietina]